MEDEIRQVRYLWAVAKRNLGVRAVIPYELKSAAFAITCDVYLPDFGGKGGIAVCARYSVDHIDFDHKLLRLARDNGMTCSIMRVSPQYREDEFREALEDWGYYGPPEQRPSWMSRT